MKTIKRTLALLLAIMALVAVVAVPAAAAQTRAQICGYCNNGYVITRHEKEYDTITVSACKSNVASSHSHQITKDYLVEFCDNCGKVRARYLNWTSEKCLETGQVY